MKAQTRFGDQSSFGCFKGGENWDDVGVKQNGEWNYASVDAACAKFATHYKAGATLKYCYDADNNNRVNFEMENIGSGPADLTVDKCVSNFKKEIPACPHGSLQESKDSH